MKREERHCSNCREPLPPGAAWCEKCGTDAGDVFDGRMPRKKRSGSGWLLVVLILVAAGVAVWMYRDKIPIRALRGEVPRTDTGPIRVVRQRPGGARRAAGAKLSEPEAVLTLRRFLTTRYGQEIKSECLAIASRGSSGAMYTFEAVDSCRGVKLGKWRVDGNTGAVKR